MTKIDQIEAVIRMQDYIHQNIKDEITLDSICYVSGYSKRHALRIFKELLSKTVFEYIRDLRLTMSMGKLINADNQKILEIALDSGFESHEGFTKAFHNHFGILPQSYRRRSSSYNYTAPTPMSYYYLLLRSKGMNNMNKTRTVTATLITKPACKLIIKRGILATDYFSYCDEIGCDIWDILNNVPDRLDNVSFVTLPEFLISKGTSNVCCAVEVPLGYNSPIPDDCEIIELAEHTMLWFQGEPYEDENWYGGAHTEMYHAVQNYKPELYGYKFAYNLAPRFVYGASAKDGCKELIPVTLLKKDQK